jgi:hypothetical protein
MMGSRDGTHESDSFYTIYGCASGTTSTPSSLFAFPRRHQPHIGGWVTLGADHRAVDRAPAPGDATTLGGALVMSNKRLLESCPLMTRRVQGASGPASRTSGSYLRDTHGARHADTTALWVEAAPKVRATVVEHHKRVWQVWQVWQSP